MDQMPVIISLTLMFGLLLLSVPIVVSISLSALLAVYLADLPFQLVFNGMFEGINSFPLLAVPFFIMAGEIMQRGSMAAALLNLSRTMVGHLSGGLGHISILTCMFYGALCGSAPATVSAVGGIMIPAMEKEGFPLKYGTALNCAGGCLGVLIPPSVPLIIFGCAANVSISDLFIAGIIPGIFIGILLMIANYVVCIRKGYGIRHPKASHEEFKKAFKEAKWAMTVPFIVLGGIYGGIFTPSEAGAVSVVYALFIESVVTRNLKLKELWEILRNTLISTVMIFIIIAGALGFGQVFLLNNTTDFVTQMFAPFMGSPDMMLTACMVLFLILGCFLDMNSIIALFVPLLMPAVLACGVDPVHFGLVTIVALAIGFTTPPVGVNLFVGVGISGIHIAQLSIAILPFIILMVIALLILCYVPQFSLFLL